MPKSRTTVKSKPARTAARPARKAAPKARPAAKKKAAARPPAKKSAPGARPRTLRKVVKLAAGSAAKLTAGPPGKARRKVAPALSADDARLMQLLRGAVKVIEDKKGVEVKRFDLRALNAFTDFLVIATGDSGVQNRAIAEGIEQALRAEFGVRAVGVEGTGSGEWVLVDYGGLVINLFTPTARDHYALERLWADAAPVH